MKDFTKLDKLLQGFADNSVPGCSCSIMQGDEFLYEGTAGYADIESGKPVNKHSMYRQASTTKLFTYAIVGMLYEEGKFLFSDPIGEYLPEWKNTKKYVMRPDGSIDAVPCDDVRPAVLHGAGAERDDSDPSGHEPPDRGTSEERCSESSGRSARDGGSAGDV